MAHFRTRTRGHESTGSRTAPTFAGKIKLPALLLLSGLLAACAGDAGVDPVEVRDLDLVVEPTKLFLAEGDAGQLHARLVDAAGDAVPMSELQWTSSDNNVATVNDDGIVNALQNGTVVITASSSGKKKGAEVGVRGKGKLEIHLSSGTGQAGPVDETLPLPLVVEVRDRTGAGVPGVDVDWKATGDDGSLSASTTTTNQNGLTQVLWTLGTVAGEQNAQAQVQGAGTVDFYATAEPGAPALVEVSPESAELDVGSKQKFEASAKDQHGNPVTDASFIWASSAGDVAYVDTTGVATGMSEGSAMVEAYAGSAQGTGSVNVSGDETAEVTSVTADTEAHTFTALGQTLQLSATATDASGATVEDVTFTWSSSHPDIATVDDMGLVFAKAVGTASVIVSALCCQEADTVLIEVTQVAASVSVNPTELTLDVGDSQILEATVLDSEGYTVDGAAVAWSSSDTNVAVIDSEGVVTAQDAGSVTFEASSGDASGTATGTVNDVQEPESEPVATSIEVSPSEFSLDVGLTQQLDAVVLDQDGNPMTEASVTWSSSDPAIATIDSEGLVTAVAAGSVTLQATSGELVDGSTGTITEPATGGDGDTDAFFYDGFESADLSNVMGGWSWGSSTRASVRSDISHSGAYSLRFRYPAAAPGGDSFSEQRFDLGRNTAEIWLEYWIYFPDGTEGLGSAAYVIRETSNNKFLRLWGDSYGADNKVGASIFGCGTKCEVADDAWWGARGWWGYDGESAEIIPFVSDIERGRWVQFRWHSKRATSETAADGILEVWWDGVQVINRSDLDGDAFSDGSDGPNHWNQGYLMGWANSGFDAETHVYIDDIKVSLTDPGW